MKTDWTILAAMAVILGAFMLMASAAPGAEQGEDIEVLGEIEPLCLEVPIILAGLGTDGLAPFMPNKVLCCCNTMSGQCCRWVSFCSGFVPGCACTF